MSPEIVDQVKTGLGELTRGGILHVNLSTASAFILQEAEQPPARVAEDTVLYSPLRRETKVAAPRSFLPPISRVLAPARRPPPWHVGMSSDFTAAVSAIDRKLQGRILEALTRLISNPLESKGDTVTPLTGELKGCWRYRIGDFRLIYSADKTSGDITLLAFSPRGAAYSD